MNFSKDGIFNKEALVFKDEILKPVVITWEMMIESITDNDTATAYDNDTATALSLQSYNQQDVLTRNNTCQVIHEGLYKSSTTTMIQT